LKNSTPPKFETSTENIPTNEFVANETIPVSKNVDKSTDSFVAEMANDA